MTEERINKISREHGITGWYSREMHVIQIVAAEAREEGIEEARDALEKDALVSARADIYRIFERLLRE